MDYFRHENERLEKIMVYEREKRLREEDDYRRAFTTTLITKLKTYNDTIVVEFHSHYNGTDEYSVSINGECVFRNAAKLIEPTFFQGERHVWFKPHPYVLEQMTAAFSDRQIQWNSFDMYCRMTIT